MMKRTIKLCISIIVRFLDICRDLVGRAVGRTRQGTCVVLYYHGISASQRGSFAAQMDEVIRLSTPVRAGLRASLTEGRHHCAITFDDGFVSTLENALPELESREMPCTMFVPTGSLGRRPAWIVDPSHPALNEMVLSPGQLRELKTHPLVTVGSHSISHPDFLKLGEGQARKELAESKAALESMLGERVRLFSFPHGKCNSVVIQMAKDLGYERVFTITPDLGLGSSDEFVTSRVAAEPDDWKLEFHLKVMGAYRWMAKMGRD